MKIEIINATTRCAISSKYDKMKTKLVIVIIIIYSSCELIGQTGWYFLNPKPTGFKLRDIKKSDDNILWTIGEYGTMLKSQDEGENWTKIELQTNAYLYDITFQGNRGWIVGADGTILFSDDFGQSWSAQHSGVSKTLHKVEFFDRNIGWILASESVILRTCDGGLFWETDTLEHQFITSNRWPLNDIKFIDPNTGLLAVGYYQGPNLDIEPDTRGALLKTCDGGDTWSVVDSGYTKYSSIFFLNDSTGWMTTHHVDSGRVILRTYNGGETWLKLCNTYDWQKMVFVDTLHGWGLYYTRFGRTNDGGRTWTIGQLLDPPNPSINFKGLFFQNSATGWIVGLSGFILKTSDAGASWRHLDDRLDIYYGSLDDVVFTDEMEGWIVGEQLGSYPESDTSLVLHTIDGGASWERQSVPTNCGLNRIWAINNEKLWAFSEEELYFTKDGGQTWIAHDFESNEERYREIFFNSENEGFLVAGRTIFKTVDGGLNWTTLITNRFSVQFLSKLVFSDNLKGWALGNRGNTYVTSDGGYHWDLSSHKFTAITFIDSLRGYAIESGSVLRTLNSGNTWSQISENPASFTNWTDNIVFVDTTYGWIWNRTDVHHTCDGGRTWQIEKGISKIASVFPGGLYMLNKDLGWAVGSDGKIFKYESDDTTSVLNPDSDGPKDHELYCNYPNPFNDKTMIHYRLAFRETIEISVFNILGEKVKVIFSGLQDAGTHNVEFSAAELSSGVYLYQLKTSTFVQTKKLLLVR
jgi:photosystem II stability/assembly factor-like uncharacterized protein